MQPLTDIVKHLIIINVIVYIAAVTFMGDSAANILAVHWFHDPRFKPYQIVSHMFMHAGIAHLFFNMFALYVFGPMVERYATSKRFLILYLASGFGALAAHQAIQYFQFATQGVEAFYPAVGASGAVMGILIAFAVLYPNVQLMLLIPPIPIKAKYLAMVYVAIDLFSGISGFSYGVANWAHLGGALTGFLLTVFWIKARRY
jgi:membrane associated rhomboid family serine protease